MPDDSRRIQRAILLDASPGEVLDLITNPERMGEWFCTRAEKTGENEIAAHWDSKGSTESIRLTSLVSEPISDGRGSFCFEWKPAHPRGVEGPGGLTRVTFDVYAEDRGARVVLNETGFKEGALWDYAIKEQHEGWELCLGHLAGVTGIIPTRVITGARLLPCNLGEAWHALTEGAQIGRWINETEIWDARLGGPWRMTTPNREIGHGWFTKLVPNTELSLSWNWYETELSPTHAEFRLEQTGSGTIIRIMHHGWGFGDQWDHELNDCRNGWNACFKALADLFEV